MRARLLAVVMLGAACHLGVDDRDLYACDSSGACPSGLECCSDALCRASCGGATGGGSVGAGGGLASGGGLAAGGGMAGSAGGGMAAAGGGMAGGAGGGTAGGAAMGGGQGGGMPLPDAGPDAGLDGGLADAGNDAGVTDAGTCATVALACETDSLINPANNNFGQLPVLNITEGIGRGVFQFSLGAMLGPAMLDGGTVRTVSLVLSRAPMAFDCGGPCPFAPGELVVFPLRSDWAEGNGDCMGGICWATRASGMPWAVPGAGQPGADRGPMASRRMVTGVEPALAFAIDLNAVRTPGAAMHPGPWLEGPPYKVSFIVVGLDGGQYTAASGENDGGFPKPRLEVEVCP